MKGRKPKPLQQRLAEGDAKRFGVHKLDEKLAALPKAVRGLPAAPRYLRGVAREQWDRWKSDLEFMEMDFVADATMLAAACVMYQRALEADETIKREGAQITETMFDRTRRRRKLGVRIRNHPAISVSHTAWRNVAAFCAELGLTLASRQRLAIDPEANRGSREELMKLLTMPREKKSEPPVN
jgi:P27 family predicted phage terminase small subunit